MTIKIICNGKVNETQIIDVASGMQLQDNCIKAVIILDAQCKHPELILKFTDVEVEVTGEVIQTFPPRGMTLDDVKAG